MLVYSLDVVEHHTVTGDLPRPLLHDPRVRDDWGRHGDPLGRVEGGKGKEQTRYYPRRTVDFEKRSESFPLPVRISTGKIKIRV